MWWHNGNTRRLRRLYEKYRTVMYAAAMEILQDAHSAEDAVHEVFARIMSGRCELVEDGREKYYLIAACRNACYDELRKRAKADKTARSEDEADTSAGYNPPQDIVLCDELETAIVRAIGELDDIYRDVFRMKMALELPDKEIAKRCRISESTVRVRLMRAKAQIAEKLEKEGLINAKPKK